MSSRRTHRGRRAVATLLTLFTAPGAGHLLLRRWLRGGAWFSTLVLGAYLSPYSGLGLALLVFSRVPAAIDLWLVRIEPDAPDAPVPPVRTVSRRAWHQRGATAAALWGVCLALLVLGRRQVFESFSTTTSAMVPTLMQGDMFVASKLAVDPERGDVVVFSYPCEPSKTYVKRVVALGGDTVELRCTRLWLDGEPAAEELVDASRDYVDVDPVSGLQAERHYAAYRETIAGASYLVAHESERPAAAHALDFPRGELPGCLGSHRVGTLEPSPPVAGVSGECAPTQRYRVPEGHVFVLGDNREASADSRVWGPVPVDAIRGEARRIWWSSTEDGGIRWHRTGAIR